MVVFSNSAVFRQYRE